MRSIPSSMDPAVVSRIDTRLDDVERNSRVTIALAVESGSRAWGFATPDSDYDSRFIYVRRASDYLSLWPARDVIETPLDAVLDVNGWDLAKALRLVVKGNAVVVEWLRSPIVYRGDPTFREAIERFAVDHTPPFAIRRHYLHLGRRQWVRHGSGVIGGKKLFYSLRPAIALRWMRQRGDLLPPMHFPTLIAESNLPAPVLAHIKDLIARKSETREIGRLSVPPAIATLIDDEYRHAEQMTAIDHTSQTTLEAADDLFRQMIEAFAAK